MRWTVGIGGTEGDGDTSTGGASTGDGGPTSSTMPTSGMTASGSGDTGPGGDTTMSVATDDGDTGDGSGTTTGVPACPASHACVEVAPEGWNGPVAFETGDTLAELNGCGGAFPDVALQMAVDAVGPDAVCACNCDDGPLTCDDVVVEQCNGGNFVLGSSAGGACYSVPNGQFVPGSGGNWTAASALAGSCSVIGSPTIDPVGYTGGIRACAGETIAEACDPGQACLPVPAAPFSGAVCIYADGDMACPAGEYATRTVYYTDFEDDRGCLTCTCDTVETLCDVAGNVTLYEATGCSVGGTGVGVVPPDGTCGPMGFNGTPISTPNSFFVQAPSVPAGACVMTPNIDQPQGGVTQIDPITVCCR